MELFTSGSIGRRMPTCWDRYAPIPSDGNTTPIVLPTFPECLSIMYMQNLYLMSTDVELNAVAERVVYGLNKDFTKANGRKGIDGGVNMGWFGFSATGKEIHQIADLKEWQSESIRQTR